LVCALVCQPADTRQGALLLVGTPSSFQPVLTKMKLVEQQEEQQQLLQQSQRG